MKDFTLGIKQSLTRLSFEIIIF